MQRCFQSLKPAYTPGRAFKLPCPARQTYYSPIRLRLTEREITEIISHKKDTHEITRAAIAISFRLETVSSPASAEAVIPSIIPAFTSVPSVRVTISSPLSLISIFEIPIPSCPSAPFLPFVPLAPSRALSQDSGVGTAYPPVAVLAYVRSEAVRAVGTVFAVRTLCQDTSVGTAYPPIAVFAYIRSETIFTLIAFVAFQPLQV